MTLQQQLTYPDLCRDMYYYDEVEGTSYFDTKVPILHLYPKEGVPAIVCSFMAIFYYALNEGEPGFLVYDKLSNELIPYFTS